MNQKPLPLRSSIHLLKRIQKYALPWASYQENEALTHLNALAANINLLPRALRLHPEYQDDLYIEIAKNTPYSSVQCRCMELITQESSVALTEYLRQCSDDAVLSAGMQHLDHITLYEMLLEASEACSKQAAVALAQRNQLQNELGRPFPNSSFYTIADRIFIAIYGQWISPQTLIELLSSPKVHNDYKLLATSHLQPQADFRIMKEVESSKLYNLLSWGPAFACKAAIQELHERGELQSALSQPEILSHPFSSALIFEEVYGTSIPLITLVEILKSNQIHPDYKAIAVQHTSAAQLTGLTVEALHMLIKHYPASAVIEALYLKSKKSEQAVCLLLELIIHCLPDQHMAAQAAAYVRALYQEEADLQPLLAPYMGKTYHPGEAEQFYHSADTDAHLEALPEVYL